MILVNISYGERRKLRAIFEGQGNGLDEKGNPVNLEVFDSSIVEIWKLLSSAFHRYERQGSLNYEFEDDPPASQATSTTIEVANE